MNKTSISERALNIIDQYKSFRVGSAVTSVPYCNNRTRARRGRTSAEVGKGSPKDILDEVEQILVMQKVDIKSLTADGLKRFMVENDMGIDCSGFAYHVLSEESSARGKGSISSNVNFVNKGVLSWFTSKLNPEKNTDVLTFASDKNSRIINIKDIKSGDIITMVGNQEGGIRNHILIVNQVEYSDSLPKNIYYIHSMAWPTDGEYGHGIHEGRIEINDYNKSIVEQSWIENEKIGPDNYTLSRAMKSTTELRRLNWF